MKYKERFEDYAKMLSAYQDIIVPNLYKQIEELKKERRDVVTNRIQELEEALLDMVNQFSCSEGVCAHTFMSAEEGAYDVLDIQYGEPIDAVYERYHQKWSKQEDAE